MLRALRVTSASPSSLIKAAGKCGALQKREEKMLASLLGLKRATKAEFLGAMSDLQEEPDLRKNDGKRLQSRHGTSPVLLLTGLKES